MRRLFASGLAALMLAAPAESLAGKKDKGRKKDRHDASIGVTFTIAQRHAAQTFFVERHGRGKCPPGLAKKNNGCLPPGQAKKRYLVGRPLPPHVVIVDIPHDLAIRIGPAPRGYRYVLVDGDIVKLAVGTLLVVDAIHGLVE